MNGDGHADLVLSNDAGQRMVSYYGESQGTTPLGTSYLDRQGSPGWKVVVPTGSAKTQTLVANGQTDSTPLAQADALTPNSVPVLIFNGTGTSKNDVIAVQNVVSTAGLAYNMANSTQLDGMSQAQLAAYKLFIVPGGNSITIGRNLSSKATSTVRNAVAQNGLNYPRDLRGRVFWGLFQVLQRLEISLPECGSISSPITLKASAKRW